MALLWDVGVSGSGDRPRNFLLFVVYLVRMLERRETVLKLHCFVNRVSSAAAKLSGGAKPRDALINEVAVASLLFFYLFQSQLPLGGKQVPRHSF